MSVFFSKKTQQGVYAAEDVKEKTQTESKQKACMGMEMEMPYSATFISGDICFFFEEKTDIHARLLHGYFFVSFFNDRFYEFKAEGVYGNGNGNA